MLIMLDAGGVLFNNITEDSPFFGELSLRCGVDKRRLRDGYVQRETAAETGRATGADTVLSVIGELGGNLDGLSPERIRRCYGDSVRTNHELLAWLAHRSPGSRPGIRLTLADNEAYDWEMVKHARARHLNLVDSLSSSWLLGLTKPDPVYFSTVLERHHVRASETLLVDDNPICLNAAHTLGIATHQYRDPGELIALLTSI